MEKRLLTIFVMGVLFCSNVAAAPEFVQAGYYPQQCTSSSCHMTFNIDGYDVTPGNLIVVGVRTDNGGGGVSSVKSNPGSQTCHKAIEQLDEYTDFWLEIWYCPNAIGGDTTVSVNLISPIGNGNRMAMAEFSGVETVLPVIHGTPISASDEGNTADAGDITTTVSSALLFIWAGCNGNNDFGPDAVPPPGWTKPYLGPDPGDGADKFAMAHYVAANPGTYGAYLENANDYWSAAAVAFAPSSSCQPDCTGKECGDDGCGGTCAPGCSGSETCNNGQCDGCVPFTILELTNVLEQWKDGTININQVMQSIQQWKRGC